MTLRELLLLQSVYACQKPSDIRKLIEAQPTFELFYKVFLELDLKCFISYLTFDSRSMEVLLDPKVCSACAAEYPVFFKAKDGRTAVDEALEENQIKSVEHMINYICEFQRGQVYAHLFENNLVQLLQNPVSSAVHNLLESEIFFFTFDFDDWPSMHTNHDEMLVPYNGTISELRFKYEEVFPELKENEIESHDVAEGAVTDSAELAAAIKKGPAASGNAK